MKNFIIYRQFIIPILTVPLFLLSINITAFAKKTDPEEIKISNIEWKIEGEVVIISYDLSADRDKEYTVEVVLENELNSSYKYYPKTISGDVGEGKFAGTGRKIMWYYKKDIPEGLSGEGYYFEIAAREAGGGIPWYYIVIGASAVGGGVLALLSSGKKNAGENQPASTELPVPPLRP